MSLLPSLFVTPLQVADRLNSAPADSSWDVVLKLPSSNPPAEAFPLAKDFADTQAWVSAQLAVYEADTTRIEALWRGRAEGAGVELLPRSSAWYLYLRGTPAVLFRFLLGCDLEEAYTVTDWYGSCGAAKAPWVYETMRDSQLAPASSGHQDAPLGLLCAEQELGELVTEPARQHAWLLRSAQSNLQWCANELECGNASSHPRFDEYQLRMATARKTLETALQAQEPAATDA